MKLKLVVSMMCMLGLASIASAAELPGPLVTAHWLEKNRDKVAVVEVREKAAEFTAAPEYSTKGGKKQLEAVGGHIPGALLVEFSKVRVARDIGGHKIGGMLPDRAYFQQLLRDAGVPKGKPVVISSPGDGIGSLDMATRLYWSMKYYGDDNIALLNGGTAGWIEAGYPVSTDAAPSAKGDWTATAERKQLLADSSTVAKAMHGHAQLIDARSTQQFLGLAKKPIVPGAGHIPGARSMPTDAMTRSSGVAHYFLSPAGYRTELKALGIKDNASHNITYCNTGHLASGAWFVMSELVGAKHTQLYDGSMLEWTTEGRPVVAVPLTD